MNSSDEKLLAGVRRDSFEYFKRECNPDNGLVKDSSRADAPASIAAVGMALSCYVVGVEAGLMGREEARALALAALRFFGRAPHSGAPDATGYKGFYYHYLDMKSGQRAWKSELSSIDTALLLAGCLTVGAYFDLDTPEERELRERAEELYRRADWDWMRNGSDAVAHGWRPERGFLPYEWRGYSEGLLLYILGLGSPSHPLPTESYAAWCSTYKWKTVYGHSFLYAGPLFIHQTSHCWIDFRGVRDEFMRAHDSDYFENSRRATLVQREYGRRNPKGFAGYGEHGWGISASGGPGPATQKAEGKARRFWGYRARGAPFGPDDGTLSPCGVAASLPFAPEIVLPTLHHFNTLRAPETDAYGLKATFNSTAGTQGWTSSDHLAIDLGPVVLMLENWRSGLMWKLLGDCGPLREGLRRAGFEAYSDEGK